MPEIIRRLEYSQIEPSRLFRHCLEIFHKMGAQVKGKKIISQNPFRGEISTFVSSIWGWGGMPISVQLIEEGGVIRIEITGYIAQLVTGPLKNKLDEFESELSILSNLVDETSPVQVASKSPIKSEDLKWATMDKNMVIFVFLGVVAISVISILLRVPEVLISFIAIPLVYYFFRRSMRS